MSRLEKARAPDDLEWAESDAGDATSFVLQPTKLNAVPLLVGTGVWDSFFVMLWMGLARVNAPRVAFLFPILHGLVGVFLTWLTLVRTLNVTRIAVGRADLTIRHAPIPHSGVRVPLASITRIEVQEARGLRLRAVMKEGRPVDLGLTLYGREQLDFVAARLNAALASARPRGA